MKRLFLLLVIFFLSISFLTSCLNDEIIEIEKGTSLADFENGQDPINKLNGFVATWSTNINPKISIRYIDTGSNFSKYCLKVKIDSNDGKNPENWTGAGLVLGLSDYLIGLSLIKLDTLSFDIKIVNYELENLRVKLEDINGSNKPEREINKYIKIELNNWQKVSIPLSDLSLPTTDERKIKGWDAVDISRITKFITISVKDKASPYLKVDGIFYIDNLTVK